MSYCPTYSSAINRVNPRTSFHPSREYSLVWRQRKLLVSSASEQEKMPLRVLEREDWLVDCLARSPIGIVKIDSSLGERRIQFWADACQKAEKPIYLRLFSSPHLPQKTCPLSWRVKRSLDWLLAALLVVLLSPIMLILAGLVAFFSPGPLFFTQWRVGARGKLFKIVKFRTMVVGAEQLHHQVMGNQKGLHKLQNDPRVTPVGRFMRKYSLDELPQLFNVLRGEMSLVGPRPWALYDAVRIPDGLKYRLNALPGITGSWQVQNRSNLLDLGTVNQGDLQYLQTWSLWKDFKFLLLTIPKVLSGFGAY